MKAVTSTLMIVVALLYAGPVTYIWAQTTENPFQQFAAAIGGLNTGIESCRQESDKLTNCTRNLPAPDFNFSSATLSKQYVWMCRNLAPFFRYYDCIFDIASCAGSNLPVTADRAAIHDSLTYFCNSLTDVNLDCIFNPNENTRSCVQKAASSADQSNKVVFQCRFAKAVETCTLTYQQCSAHTNDVFQTYSEKRRPSACNSANHLSLSASLILSIALLVLWQIFG